MVALFAEHSISARNTIHPNLWKKSGKEPADLMIVMGRAAFFVNTKGFGGAIAGRPIMIRYVDNRTLQKQSDVK
jgi:hypothetical protein